MKKSLERRRSELLDTVAALDRFAFWRSMEDDTKPLCHLRMGDPQVTADFRQNELVAKVSKLYAEAAPEDQLALRVWMRDILLGRTAGIRNLAHASRLEKRSREACEGSILEFPREMDARKFAEELQREGWYSGATNREYIVLGFSMCVRT